MSFTKLVEFEVNGDLDDDWMLDWTHMCHVRSALAHAARACSSIVRWLLVRIGHAGVRNCRASNTHEGPDVVT